jgi:hypothetical protein
VLGEQILHAVGVAPGLLVGGESKNNVPVRHEAFLLQANQRGEYHRVLTLHVLRAAAVKIPVARHQFERIGTPGFGIDLHHVQVTDKKQRLAQPAPVQADDDVALGWVVRRRHHGHIRRRKPGGQRPLLHGDRRT